MAKIQVEKGDEGECIKWSAEKVKEVSDLKKKCVDEVFR